MNAVTDCSACDGDDLCIVCHKAPATVPDRNTVSLKKRLCAACHQARLRDDILRVLAAQARRPAVAVGVGVGIGILLVH